MSIYSVTQTHHRRPFHLAVDFADLRRFNKRHGGDLPSVFYKNATTGRPDKGMPNWTVVAARRGMFMAKLKNVLVNIEAGRIAPVQMIASRKTN